MICPFCKTVNRDDQDTCYYCNRDLSMLRLIVNRARHHYNLGVELAEHGKYDEAIRELSTSLDLDKANPHAYLVLGTVYARQQNFTEANEMWEKVLAHDQNFLKAHQYLIRSKVYKQKLSWLKWLNFFVILSLLLLLTTAVLTFSYHRASSEDQFLLDAWQAYKTPDFFGALTILDSHQSFSDEAAQLAALTRSLIAEQCQQSLERAQQFLDAGSFALAVDELTTLREKKPPPKIFGQTEQLLHRVKFTLQRELKEEEQKFSSSFSTPTSRWFELAQVYLSSFPDDRFAQELQKTTANLEQAQLHLLLADLRSQWQRSHDSTQLTQLTSALKAKYPQFAHEIDEAQEQIFLEYLEEMLTEAGQRARQKEFEEAEKLLDQLTNLPLPQAQTKSETLREEIASLRTQHQLKLLKSAWENHDFKRFLSLAQKLDPAYITEVQQIALEEQIQMAQRNVALASYQWLETRDEKFEGGEITSEEANYTIEHFQFVLDHLPPGYLGVRHQVLFFAGAAYLKLGFLEEAKELFGVLERRYPESPYLEKAKQLLEAFSAE